MKILRIIVPAAIFFTLAIIPKTVDAAFPVAGIFDKTGQRIASVPEIQVGSSVVAGDLNSDGNEEIIAGSPRGTHATVTVLTHEGKIIKTIFPYGTTSKSGVNVAVSPNKDVIVVGPRADAPPLVKVLSSNGDELGSFLAYAENMKRGVTVAIGDINGDNEEEIITGTGPWATPHVRYFTLNGKVLGGFFAASKQDGGVEVQVMPDFDNDGINDILAIIPSTCFIKNIVKGKKYEIIDEPTYFDNKPESLYTYGGNCQGGLQRTVVRKLQGKPRFIFAQIGGYLGPAIIQSGKADAFIFYPFTSEWKGSAAVTPIEISGGTKVFYFVTPGNLFQTPAQQKRYDGNSPSELPKDTNSRLERKTISTKSGRSIVTLVTIRLKQSSVRARGVQMNCPTGKNCGGSLAQYIKHATGFTGINGDLSSSATPASITDFFNLSTKSVRGLFFDTRGNWYFGTPVSTGVNYSLPTLATFSRKGIKINSMLPIRTTTTTYLRPLTPPNICTNQFCMNNKLRVGIGLKGSDLYLLTLSANDIVYREAVEALEFSAYIHLDGGGTAALWYKGKYLVGPGRPLKNALVLTE